MHFRIKSFEDLTSVSKCLIVLFATVASLAFTFRDFFFSNLVQIAGDRGDGRFITVTLEHWYHTFQGAVKWQSPLFFWPIKGVLGYSDGLFLMALPYSIFRAFGSDPFLSMELTLVTLRFIGFIFFFLLLWHIQEKPGWFSLFGALLFSSLNSHYLAALHPQMFSVSLLPLIIYLFIRPTKIKASKFKWSQFIYTSLSGLLLGLLFLTSFYTAWFFSFILLLYGGSWYIIISFRYGIKCSFTFIILYCYNKLRLIIFLAAGFIAGVLPAAWLYINTLRTIGHRSLGNAIHYAPLPVDLINTGPKNLLWGWLSKNSAFFSFNHELAYGITPILFLFFTIFFIYELIKIRTGPLSSKTSLAIGLTIIIAWLFTLKIKSVSLWAFIYYLIPGAKAISALGRINILIGGLVILTLIELLDRVKSTRFSSYRTRLYTLSFITACMALTLSEQINTGTVHIIDRKKEMVYLKKVPEPPSDCKVFFITQPFKMNSEWYEMQLDAVIISITTNTPTVNGYSGNFPIGYGNPTSDEYLSNISKWLVSKGLKNGIYSFNGQNFTWKEEHLLNN